MNQTIDNIKHVIENTCSDWLKLSVLNVKVIDKKYIVATKDLDGYLYNYEFNVYRNARKRNLELAKFFRNNSNTIENIKNYLKLNNKPFILKSTTAKNAHDKLIWNCSEHGDFTMAWNTVKNGQGCPTCGKLQAHISRRNEYDYVKSKFEEKGLVLLSSQYINNLQKLDYICKKHEEYGIQQTIFASLISHVHTCRYCANESIAFFNTKTHGEFLIELRQVHGDKYTPLEEYTNCKIHIKMLCNNCNMEFSMCPNHILDGHGCKYCTKSKGEVRVKEWLISNDIKFIQEYGFDDCRNKRVLPFDFYIPDYNLLIEYQGIQHFKPVEIFGGEEMLKTQQENDKKKSNYCKLNNINLLEINYKDYKNVDEILSKYFDVRH